MKKGYLPLGNDVGNVGLAQCASFLKERVYLKTRNPYKIEMCES